LIVSRLLEDGTVRKGRAVEAWLGCALILFGGRPSNRLGRDALSGGRVSGWGRSRKAEAGAGAGAGAGNGYKLDFFFVALISFSSTKIRKQKRENSNYQRMFSGNFSYAWET
jgi:hypothetical protein